MTTLTVPMTSSTAPTTTTARYRQTFGGVIRSEWIKLTTLRSTWAGMLATIVVLVGLAAAAAATAGTATTPSASGVPTDALHTVFTGASLAMLLLGVLGCLAGAREYGSRMIAVTAAAVPRRWQIVVAKLVALVGVVVPTTLIGSFGAYGVGMAMLSANGSPTVGLFEGDTLTSVLGMAGYLTAVAAIGLGLGFLFRSTAASIGAVAGGFLVIPLLAATLLPDSWEPVLRFLPSNAGAAFTALTAQSTELLSAGVGVVVVIAWVAAAIGGAIWRITTSDV